MRKVLIITADYFPNPSSNTTCFQPFLESILNKGDRIDIVTRRLHVDEVRIEKENKQLTIYRVDDTKSMNTLKINNWVNRKKRSPLRKIISLILKGLNYAFFNMFNRDKHSSYWGVNKVYKACKKLNKQKEYDLVISISHPATTHFVAHKLIKNADHKPKWLWYEFDPFSHNEYIYGNSCYKRLMPLHRKMLKSCDKVITTIEIGKLYNEDFNEVKNKFESIPYANMKEIKNEDTSKPLKLKNNVINCFYAGALGKEIRDPSYAIEIIKNLGKDIHFTMITGSKTDFIEHLIKGNKSLTTLPGQPRDVAYSTMLESDILISIGNLVNKQIPGKIFEYMALGKPFIHFSSIEDDPCVLYFKGYPMVLVIKAYEKNIESDQKLILDFCQKYKGKKITYDEVKKYIPHLASENIVKRFNRIIEDILKEENYEKK